MVQPKTPPLSIRLPSATLAALKDEAERRKVTVNAVAVRAIQKEIGQWSDEEIASMRAQARSSLMVNRIAPSATTWPSGALIEPHHTEDPAPKLTLGSAVTFGYQRPKPGERSKKPKR